MNIDDLVAERIAAARRRVEADKERRARIEAARAAGLHYRRRDRLAHIAERGPAGQPDGETAPGNAVLPPQTAQQPAQAPEPKPDAHKPSQPRIRPEEGTAA